MSRDQDFRALSDRLFLIAILGQVGLSIFVFVIVLGVVSWRSQTALESKLQSYWLEWESQITEEVYINQITQIFDMNQLKSVEDFRRALKIAEIPANIRVENCQQAYGLKVFELELGARRLNDCIVVEAEVSPFTKAAAFSIGILLLSLALSLFFWRFLRHRFQSKILSPLIHSLEKEVQDAARGKMAAQIAHDIRSPLLALNVFQREAHALPEEKRVLLRSAIQRIQDISVSLLPQKKSLVQQEEEAELFLVPVLVEELLTEKRFQYRDRMDIRIEWQLEATGYSCFSRFKSTEFQRSLSNLIDNAVEASEHFGGEVLVGLCSREGELRLFVEDRGCGMPPDVLKHLGEKGLSVDKPHGTGLGLSYAYEFARRAGGFLEVSARQGGGTSVSLVLPKVGAPQWFLERLSLPEKSKIVVIDDDDSVHLAWKNRVSTLLGFGESFEMFHFKALSALNSWWKQNRKDESRCVFLVDFEFVGFEGNGLDWIVDESLQSRSILVTGRYGDKSLRRRCEIEGVKLLPKPLVAFVPILSLRRGAAPKKESKRRQA